MGPETPVGAVLCLSRDSHWPQPSSQQKSSGGRSWPHFPISLKGELTIPYVIKYEATGSEIYYFINHPERQRLSSQP